MKYQFSFLASVLLSSCAVTTLSQKDPIYLFQTVQPTECLLAETGYKVWTEMGNKNRSSPYIFIGRTQEINPQVYSCTVEIPMHEFKDKLGYCVLRGYNYSAGYNFFKGEQKTRMHSCDARPLKNGNFYFHADGIDQDSCDWICFPPADK